MCGHTKALLWEGSRTLQGTPERSGQAGWHTGVCQAASVLSDLTCPAQLPHSFHHCTAEIKNIATSEVQLATQQAGLSKEAMLYETIGLPVCPKFLMPVFHHFSWSSQASCSQVQEFLSELRLR